MQLSEHCAYNALATKHRGDYRALDTLYERHSSWSKAFAAQNGDTAEAQTLFSRMSEQGIRLILRKDPEFPRLLKEIPWPPHALYLRGAPLSDIPHVAIVGTRKATPTGFKTAERIAADLSRAGVGIVSGLAFGIDVAAHCSTLVVRGRAVAVLASGLDRITPRSNEQVGAEIIKCGGTLISEYPVGTKTLPRFFIERNRIVSGLSLGTVVIEAPVRSGTLATARFTTEQNRELFVVPGPISEPNYEGSHSLIKSGAALITGADDVLSALSLAPTTTSLNLHAQPLPFLDETGTRIVEVLSVENKPLTVDIIAERTQLGITVLNEALALLTIEGIVREDGSSYYI